MKKSIVAVTILSIIGLVLSISINSQAANYPDSFDPVFYANTYPDVVNVFGTTDPNVMYDHYIKYGYAEGRYQNATEQTAAIPAIMLNAVPIDGYDTYIDVNKTYQVVTYFENGEIKLQCPCVTGNERGHGTPVGVYSIKVKVPGKTLVGPTWRCWVDRWMRFTDNSIGLHELFYTYPKDIIQSLNLSYSRIQFYKTIGIEITMDNYNMLFYLFT